MVRFDAGLTMRVPKCSCGALKCSRFEHDPGAEVVCDDDFVYGTPIAEGFCEATHCSDTV
jgi:hypothetical protein